MSVSTSSTFESPHAPDRQRGFEAWLAPALILVVVLLQSLRLGTDVNWDLRNYHLYNPFAFFNKPPGTDIAPAQLQSFLPPTIDLIPYQLRRWLNDFPRALALVLALPNALAAILAYRIGIALIRPIPGGRVVTSRWLAVLLATLLGFTGATNLLTVGSSLSEMPAGCFVLGALLVLLTGRESVRPSAMRSLVAGLLAGCAIGIKLTMVPFGVGLGIAFAVCMVGPAKSRLMHLVAFGVGGAVGAAVLGGPAWLELYHRTGSPVFPYFNAVFQSPLYDPVNVSDDRFKPTTAIEKLFFPFFWAFSPNTKNTELPLRDPRMAIAYVAIVTGCLINAWRLRTRPDGAGAAWQRRALAFAVFFAIGFALWEFQFSIVRYLATLELVSGIALLVLLEPLLRRPSTGWIPAVALAGLLVACTAFTIYPQWRAAPSQGEHAVVVEAPDLPRDSMVLVMSPDPMSYVAAFVDPAVRFIGVSSNMVSPGATTGLARMIESAVREHRGPLWGLETDEYPAERAKVLAYYGLHRAEGCTPIRTNLDGGNVRICRLLPDAP